MTASLHMPNVVVEIAFDSGFSTPAVDRTWTDVSDYVELTDSVSIGFGRGDERSTAEANTLSLRLDNRDGRFTPARASSPYYPNVKLYRPIRVTATPAGGTESVRFTGYVNEWPTEWDGTDAYASATLTASSRLARLGLSASLRSIVEEVILADSPVAYYPLGEPEGSTSAADVSGNHADSLTLVGAGAGVVFGQAIGPATDGLTAATFVGGKRLAAAGVVPAGAGGLECFFLVDPGATAVDLLDGDMFDLQVDLTGRLAATGQGLSGGPSVNDGATHHAAVVLSGGTARLYVDGAEVDSGAAAAVSAGELRVGPSNGLAAVISHVAVFGSAPSAARIAAHAAAGLTGYAGDTTGARLMRYAELGGIPPAEVVTTAATTTMVHLDSTGAQVVEMMRRVETAEDGVLHDARNGNLTLTDRNDRYLAAAAFTLDMGAQQVEADFAPRLDASMLLNDVAASNSGGTITARYTNAASIADYGSATGSVETASEDEDEPLQAAAWLVEQYAEPRVRVASISVDILPLIAATQDAILAATIGTLFTVTNLPSQHGSSTESFFVEGYTETIGPESWVISFNVSSAWPYTSLFVIDSSEIDGPDLIAR